MTSDEILNKLQHGFKMLGTRGTDTETEYFSLCSENKERLFGPLYSINFVEGVMTEHNETSSGFLASPRKKFFEHYKHRKFAEITEEGFDMFFELGRRFAEFE